MSFNKEEFARLLKLSKGDRSINQYALHSGISSAHISRLMRGLLDTPPNPDTIKSLAEKAYGEVTYNELMKAAGHFDKDSGDATEWNSKLPELTAKDEKDIAADLEKMINDLDSASGYAAFDGRSIDELSEDEIEDRELLLSSLENSLRLAKRIAKQKFTPKKYRD